MGITTNWGLKYASSTVGEKFIFTKLMHKKFFKNKKTRNNFFFLFIVYSTR